MQGQNQLYQLKFFEHVEKQTLDALWEAGKINDYKKMRY